MSKKFNNQIIDDWIINNRPQAKRKGNYTNARTATAFQCECGNIWEVRWDSFRQGSQCPECRYKKTADKLLGNNETFDTWIKINRPNTKRIDNFIDEHTPILMQCECGNTWMSAPNNFKHMAQCPICKQRKITLACQTPQEIAQKQIDEQGLNYDIIEYNGMKKKSKLICRNCKTIFSASLSNVLKNNSLCKVCDPDANISKGERCVLNWLKENNIDYIYQCHTYINNKHHYFDFYLLKYNTFIEVDGGQHRNPIEHWGGQLAFNKLQRRDAEKDMYCYWNKYDLIRIPTNGETANEEIIKILEKELQQ